MVRIEIYNYINYPFGSSFFNSTIGLTNGQQKDGIDLNVVNVYCLSI